MASASLYPRIVRYRNINPHTVRRITMDVIKVEKRDEQAKANQLRRSGLVPAVFMAVI
jgi:hypothetical protein